MDRERTGVRGLRIDQRDRLVQFGFIVDVDYNCHAIPLTPDIRVHYAGVTLPRSLLATRPRRCDYRIADWYDFKCQAIALYLI
jgi:hypothetical protein